jgi:hypothetical protein
MKARTWLDRDLLVGPYLTLCLSEADYHSACADLGIPVDGPWISNDQSHATVHTRAHPRTGQLCSIVCINVDGDRTGIEIAGLLTHEAVHIWQNFRRWIGEDKPGDEAEAYAIQRIAQRLMHSYAEQTS